MAKMHRTPLAANRWLNMFVCFPSNIMKTCRNLQEGWVVGFPKKTCDPLSCPRNVRAVQQGAAVSGGPAQASPAPSAPPASTALTTSDVPADLYSPAAPAKFATGRGAGAGARQL